MSAVVDWSVPFLITSPQGLWHLNQPEPDVGGALFLLDKGGCSSQRPPRVDRTNRAQSSGEILHPHFSGGYEMSLRLQFYESADKPACDDLLQAMFDFAARHVNAMLGDIPVLDLVSVGRIQWTPHGPPGTVDRMLNGIRTNQLDDLAFEGDTPVSSFQVMTPLPYVMDAPETDTAIGGSGTATLTNGGSAAFYPVIKVHGPSTGFHLINHSVVDANGDPLEIVYDSTLPGAHAIASGHYVELVFFNESAYLDGNVADYKPGIDILSTDWWPLMPGANLIEIDGASATVLWQNAYA